MDRDSLIVVLESLALGVLWKYDEFIDFGRLVG